MSNFTHAATYASTPIAFAWIDPSSHTVVSAASAPIAFRTLAGCGTTVPITDDTISDPIPLGFNFQFAGVVVDSVRIVSNGRLQFLNQTPANGAVFDNVACGFGTPDQFPFPNANVPYTMKVYGADIDPTNIEEAPAYTTRCSLTGAGAGPFGALPCFVSFATTGSVPNQQFIVTWNNVPEFTSGNSPQGNFQLQAIVQQDGTFIYQYGVNSSVSAAEIGWQADPNAGDFDIPNVGPLPPQNLAVEFYIVGSAASVMATGGTPQSAVINTAFASALQATVKDVGGNPVAGVTVNFAVPGSGASATLSAASAVTNSSGVASVTATANATAGSYNVTASVVGVATPATFSLTNTAGSAAFVSALSRKVHGGAGTFDLPLSLVATNPTTEPRIGPAQMIVFTFDKTITGATATVTEGTATAAAPTFSGADVVVALTGVNNQQYVTISLTNVASTDGGTGGSASVRVGFLVGDVNQNRVVTVADLGLVNAQLAQPVTAANYLKDVNANGTLTVSDKSITNTNLSKALPAP